MSQLLAEPSHPVNSTTAGDQTGAIAVMLPGGGHFDAWTSVSGSTSAVDAQLFSGDNTKAGGELVLFPGYSLGGMAAMGDGTLVASLTRSWYDPNSGPHSAVYVARIDTTGNVLMAPQQIATGGYDVSVSGGEVFVRPDGGYGVTVNSTSRPTPVSDYWANVDLFDAGGSPAGTTPSVMGAYLAPSDIAQTASGGFVVADFPYTGPGPSRMDWKTLDGSGNTVASAAFASTYGQTSYGFPSVVSLADGNSLVVWSYSTQVDGAMSESHQAQWIDAGGHPVGAPFTWDFEGAGTPRLTALAGGGFVATWTSYVAYGVPYPLHAQVFDASAHAVSASMVVASLDITGFDPGYSVTATADGGFLLDYPVSGDGKDVVEQKFDVATGPDVISVSPGSVTPIPAGAHTVVGTDGIDTISVAGALSAYTVTETTLTGPGVADTLSGIERIQFGDGLAVALDVNGHAGEAYRLYAAAFDRAPDLAGLGFHINDLDHGVSLSVVAQHFVESPEFQSKYGTPDNTQFITLLYENVLHREPEAAGLQFHLQEFAAGQSRADMLTHFSESPENQANVIGQIANGMDYIPLA